jgi:hypothetical protein
LRHHAAGHYLGAHAETLRQAWAAHRLVDNAATARGENSTGVEDAPPRSTPSLHATAGSFPAL